MLTLLHSFTPIPRTTKVGDFELKQVRTARFIGLDQVPRYISNNNTDYYSIIIPNSDNLSLLILSVCWICCVYGQCCKFAIQ